MLSAKGEGGIKIRIMIKILMIALDSRSGGNLEQQDAKGTKGLR
jgi:hypothetical protein